MNIHYKTDLNTNTGTLSHIYSGKGNLRDIKSNEFVAKLWPSISSMGDLDYSDVTKVNVNFARLPRVSVDFDYTGHVGADEYTVVENLSVDKITKTAFAVTSSGSSSGFEKLPYLWNPMRFGSYKYDVRVTGTITPKCRKNKGAKGCTATLTSVGALNGNKFDASTTYKHVGWKASVDCKYNGDRNMLKLKLNDPKKYTLIWIDYTGKYAAWAMGKKASGKTKLLVAQVPGPDGVMPIVNAAMQQHVAPLMEYVMTVYHGMDTTRVRDSIEKGVRAAAYADLWISSFTNELDCGRVVKASNVESEIIAARLGWSTCQEGLQKLCRVANAAALDVIKPASHDAMKHARGYLQNLTGQVGEDRYDAWQRTNFPMLVTA